MTALLCVSIYILLLAICIAFFQGAHSNDHFLDARKMGDHIADFGKPISAEKPIPITINITPEIQAAERMVGIRKYRAHRRAGPLEHHAIREAFGAKKDKFHDVTIIR